MKRLLLIATVCCALCLPATAADRQTEASFALAYSDIDNIGEAASIDGTLLIPMFGHQLIGPAVGLTWASPQNQPDVTGGGLGAAWEMNLFDEGGSGPFLGLEALYITGDASDIFDYMATAKLGLKFGGDCAFVKAYLSKSRHFGVQDVDDFDSVGMNVGIGLRF